MHHACWSREVLNSRDRIKHEKCPRIAPPKICERSILIWPVLEKLQCGFFILDARSSVESLGTGVRPVCASEESTHDSEPVKPRMLRLKVQLDQEGKLTQERQHKINT